MTGTRVPHPIEVLHGGGVALACGLDGQLRADGLHGLFAADTRVLSTYRLTLGGHAWQLLGRNRSGHGTATWCFQNAAIGQGTDGVPEGVAFLQLRRRVDAALHDDLRICAYAPLRARLAIQVDADFADLFEVKSQTVPPRVAVERVPVARGIHFAYQRSGFRRALRLCIDAPTTPDLVGSLIVFELDLRGGEEWSCCLEAVPEVDGAAMVFTGDPHAAEDREATSRPRLAAAEVLQAPFDRGLDDLHALAMPRPPAPPLVAAGAPWFLALFGPDPLLVGVMAGLAGSWPAVGALAALAPLQAKERDDRRDAEPGKLPHELRTGELAHLGLIPHTPYYGTHDAPSLFCLALWCAWRWTGDGSLLDRHLDAALTALRWAAALGDRDEDGLQEYETRSRDGYYNQGWKDSGDAIVEEEGQRAPLPLAPVELQGYLYAARLAVAELLAVSGEDGEAIRLREAAASLRAAVERRYWLDDQDCYALALDGHKRPVQSIASNPGQLLWSGLPARDRAGRVARRLLEPDLWTGWGIRTLSSAHPAYNPLSYQRGSVWPHDTALAAAGMWRYGFRRAAARLFRGVLDAACAFEDDRLPELFCGFDRSMGPPVPYVEANVPQAWAAATPVLAAQTLLGVVPDAPSGRCHVAPWLPEWLPTMEVRDLVVGDGKVDISVARDGTKTVIERVRGRGVDVVQGHVAAPLWGRPHPRRTTVRRRD